LDFGAESAAREQLVVVGGVGLARARPVVEVLQLDHEHGRLQLVEPEVASDERVVVLRFAAVHAQNAHALVQSTIIGDARTRVAECAEVFRREEREATDIADAAGAPAVRERRTDGLRGILDDGKPVLARQLHERAEVGHLTVEMDRQQRSNCSTRLSIDEPVALELAPLRYRLWTATGSRLNVEGSMSQKNGRAPSRATTPAVAKNVNGVVMTSSPGPMSSAMSASRSASVPERQAEAVLRLRVRRDLRFELRDARTQDEALRVAHLSIAASISARSGAYWPFRSSSGTCMVVSSELVRKSGTAAEWPGQRR
jgi:hypothetical protein